jgi:hypothetical protein
VPGGSQQGSSGGDVGHCVEFNGLPVRSQGLHNPAINFPHEACQFAQEFLEARLPGTEAADEADTFCGYCPIHVLKYGKVYGMLGVNGYSGWVWYHEWHGNFVRMLETEGR